ncbi:hypothetical protein [Pedobacter sp. NJ-S-72]
MKTFQKSSLKMYLLIAVLLFIAGCGTRNVQKASLSEQVKAKIENKSTLSGNVLSSKSDSTKRKVIETDKSKTVQTAESEITADSIIHDAKTGKTTFKGHARYTKKSTKSTNNDKRITDSNQSGFKESANSNFNYDSGLKVEFNKQIEANTKDSQSEGSVFHEWWFWLLVAMLIIALFYFSRLWR